MLISNKNILLREIYFTYNDMYVYECSIKELSLITLEITLFYYRYFVSLLGCAAYKIIMSDSV